MPGAIGWAPALLPSRGGVIAQPKVQSRNSDSARCDWEIEEVAEAALLPVAPTLRSGKLDCPVKYRFLRRSNILAIRAKTGLNIQFVPCRSFKLGTDLPQDRSDRPHREELQLGGARGRRRDEQRSRDG